MRPMAVAEMLRKLGRHPGQGVPYGRSVIIGLGQISGGAPQTQKNQII